MPFFSQGFPQTQPVSGSVTVSGSVSVSNFPAGFNVNNFPAGFGATFNLGMKFNGWTAFAGQVMTNAAAGQGMAFALIDISAANPLWESALLMFKTKMGGVAPIAGAALEYYLIRRTDVATESDDSIPDAGQALGASPFDQADLILGFNVTATANKVYARTIDLLGAFGPLGSTKWGLGFRNGTSQSLTNVAGDHVNKHNMYAKVAT